MRLFFAFGLLFALATPVRAENMAPPYCPWAPGNPAVCAGREVCKTRVHGKACALYCNVNPYDVVCGDVYRRDGDDGSNPSDLSDAAGPHGYCYMFPNDISCQGGLPWDQ